MAGNSDSCANPLLRDWVGEWMEEAKAMQSKAYYTYKKAYDSLNRCPIPFNHPSESQQLQGIGAGLAGRLEKQMIKHCEENGLPIPTRVKGKRKRQGNHAEEDNANESEGSSQRKARPKKPYVPRYRTGAYAILLCLLECRENNQQQLSREQIIRRAQDHCDASFELADPGKSYTAWNSIKTLMEKDFVWKHGSPPKYMLTDSGYDMARKLQSAGDTRGSTARPRKPDSDDSGDDIIQGEDEVDLSLYVLDPSKYRRENPPVASSIPTQPLVPTSSQHPKRDKSLPATASSSLVLPLQRKDSIDDDTVICLSTPPSPPPLVLPSSPRKANATKSQTFEYTYLDTLGSPVRHVSQAAIDFDEVEQCLTYRVQFYANQLNHPKTKFLIDIQEEKDGLYTAYLLETQADAICSGLSATPAVPINPPSSAIARRLADTPPSQELPKATHSLSAPIVIRDTQSQPVPTNTLDDEDDEPTPYAAGSYEVVLVLDNREIKMRSNRDYIQEKLLDKGVRVVKRGLELGDMIWVAQKRGLQSPSDELFLDFVVERKRLDDLVSSIKDGRFIEQKSRLRKAGARKVVYIVEEYNREEANNFGAQAIQTAMSSTQVVDKFFLKRTGTIDETIDYLVSMTKMIQKIYEHTTLYRIPEHFVSRETYLDLKRQYRSDYPQRTHVISYPLYNRLNSKYGTSSLSDVYQRMLRTIRGVSLEKAQALINAYPTPHALLQALDGVSQEQGKSLAREATKGGITRRRWGGQLSERLWQVWGSSSYRDEEEGN